MSAASVLEPYEGRRLLAWAAVLYVAVLPLGHLVTFSLLGAAATLSDLVLVGLLLAGGVTLIRSAASGGEGGAAGWEASPRGLAVLAGFGAWIALSALWSFHPAYALAKGMGVLALAGGALVLARSGAGFGRLVDGWLMGAATALGATFLLILVGSDAMEGRLLYAGGLVGGLPFTRLRGPFAHPNLFGDYLFVSGVLLWLRWPALGAKRPFGVALAAALALALGLAVSSATAAVGVALLVVALSRSVGMGRGGRVAAGALGAVLAGGTLLGAVRSLSVAVGGMTLTTGGIRPHIWASALGAVREAPFLGVGAAPFLAETADPVVPGGLPVLWDAHSTYVSVLGQFGPVGMLLFFGGLALVARALLGAAGAGGSGEGPPVGGVARARLRVAAAALAAGLLAHWVMIAGEDFRHLWALLGLAAAASLEARRR